MAAHMGSHRPFTLTKAIALTDAVGTLVHRLPADERHVLGAQMTRYAFLIVGRLSNAYEVMPAERRYRAFAAARGAVFALAGLLDLSVRVRLTRQADVEGLLITCDELGHILYDLAGAPRW